MCKAVHSKAVNQEGTRRRLEKGDSIASCSKLLAQFPNMHFCPAESRQKSILSHQNLHRFLFTTIMMPTPKFRQRRFALSLSSIHCCARIKGGNRYARYGMSKLSAIQWITFKPFRSAPATALHGNRRRWGSSVCPAYPSCTPACPFNQAESTFTSPFQKAQGVRLLTRQ